MRIAVLAALVTGLAGPALAQDLRDFCAERPGKATPPCILDKSHWQVEVGLFDETVRRGAGRGHEDDYAIGAFEVRYGLTRRLEVEGGWTPLVIVRPPDGGRVSGVGDAVLGLRTALTDPDADGPAVSVQAFVTAPTATRGLGAGGWTGGVRLPVAVPLGRAWDLGLTPEVDVVRDGDGHGTHFAAAGAIGVSRGFGALTLSAELWAQRDDDPAEAIWQASADVAAAVMIGKHSQLDAGLNLGLNDDTPGVEVYAGIARRF